MNPTVAEILQRIRELEAEACRQELKQLREALSRINPDEAKHS
jgi:hypothetical protein